MSFDLMTILAACLLICSGCMSLFRHYLLEPRMTHYPKAPRWLRTIFFFFGTGCLYLGLRTLLGYFDGEQPTQMRFLMATCLIFMLKVALLINTLRQRMPGDLWRSLDLAEQAAHLRANMKD